MSHGTGYRGSRLHTKPGSASSITLSRAAHNCAVIFQPEQYSPRSNTITICARICLYKKLLATRRAIHRDRHSTLMNRCRAAYPIIQFNDHGVPLPKRYLNAEPHVASLTNQFLQWSHASLQAPCRNPTQTSFPAPEGSSNQTSWIGHRPSAKRARSDTRHNHRDEAPFLSSQ